MATPLLAIDTAAARLQLALLMGERADTLVEDMAQGQAERIFPAIGQLLERNGIAYPDLARIAVTTGPGSFTGLRIGLSAARGLGLGLGIPVVGVPTLTALSLSAMTGGPLSVRLDARRNEEYLQHFSAPGVPAGDPQLLQVGSWLCGGQEIVGEAFVDIAALARFAAGLDPAAFPPEATYIRDADAKPQDKFRVARVGSA